MSAINDNTKDLGKCMSFVIVGHGGERFLY